MGRKEASTLDVDADRRALLSCACGRVYYPFELKTVSRSERTIRKRNNNIVIVSMTTKKINLANSSLTNVI